MKFEIPDSCPWAILDKDNQLTIEDRVYLQLIDKSGHAVSDLKRGKLDVHRDGLYCKIELIESPGFCDRDIIGAPSGVLISDSRGIVARACLPESLTRVALKDGEHIRVTPGTIATLEGISSVHAERELPRFSQLL